MNWWDAYVGLPFGEGRGEVTCWSLVVRVFAERRGIALPTYGEISARDLARIARTMGRAQLGETWAAVSAPAQFDVAIMRSGSGRAAIVHVGVMIDATRMLHVEAASHAVVVPITHHSVRGRIAGFRRYQA
ncbi:C40 family peptidase [Defluviimonas sp. WL0002]|uniref:C40 family peptidase n=1 Tax=Albidovulum marisflavi TaxID=2984159 RepID=A0ABT2ZHM2_9RHOB|nr:C40 family peptidase [Defluviimonas sp. WL0002]MCV2870629.1 C40 family peptidase [Defluviimonas sp. WL0002]